MVAPIPRKTRPLAILVAIVTAAVSYTLSTPPAAADDAPGAPGISSAWTTGAKQGLGTSATTASKLWFSLGQGITNEVYYPTVEVPNVQDLQYVVSDGGSFTQLERDHTTRQVILTDLRALSYQQVNTATNGRYRITKSYSADPARAHHADRDALRGAQRRAVAALCLVQPVVEPQRHG